MIGGMSTVSDGDARGLLEVASAIEYDPRHDGFTAAGLQALLELLGADWISYCDRPLEPPHFAVKTEVESRPFAGHVPELEAIFLTHKPEYALGSPLGNANGVTLIGDLAPRSVWRRTAFYNEWCREIRIEPQAKVALTVPGSRSRSLMIDLADDALRPFGARERTLLTLIRPLFMRPIAAFEALKQRHRALRLTARELEVLDLVRRGMTNGEIAAELFLSPATVRTHLEHAFSKIGVHTRTAAIARLAEISRPDARGGA
jgi:DNA-binding CsgD family transcriptional regulator